MRGIADVHFELRDCTLAGDVVVSEWAAGGQGQASGAPIQWSTFTVVRVRDGRIAKAQGFLSMAEALEAAGLRE